MSSSVRVVDDDAAVRCTLVEALRDAGRLPAEREGG